MREIKFRAWDKKNNEMLLNILFENEVYFYSTYEYMQYTGLMDKNGKEIYEGDIVKHKVFGIRQITWGSDYDCLKGNLGFMYNKTLAFLHENDSCEVEVIGNIFENPELLQEDNPNE